MDAPLIRISQEKINKYVEESDKALAAIKVDLDAKQREISEWNSLIHCLEELPKKREHTIMSPIGSVGFLPATIIRTNEVLVGLGSGYFVDTTVYHAIEILKRRKTVIENDIAALQQNQNLVIESKEFVEQLFNNQNNRNEVEICEEYDETKEVEFRKKRKSRVAAPQMLAKTVADVNAEAETMKQLEELELMETRNGELNHTIVDKKAFELPNVLVDLRRRDDEHTKCLTSILDSKEARNSSALLRSNEIQIAAESLQSSNAGEPDKDSSSLTTVKSDDSASNDYNAENRESMRLSVQEATEGTLGVEITLSDGFERMYTKGSKLREMDIHSSQPPHGISTEEYQKLLRIVDSINSGESDYDSNSEESESYSDNKEAGHMKDCVEEGSELDSDGAELTEVADNYCGSNLFSKRVQLGEYVVQNVGRCGPLSDKAENDQKHSQSKVPGIVTVDAVDVNKYCFNRATDDEHKVKKKANKKNRNVTFAENLESATTIDKHAPPSDVRGLTTSTSSMVMRQILSNPDEKSPINQQREDRMIDKVKPSTSVNCNTGFPGVVQERNLDVFTSHSVLKVIEEPEKARSLFKARRMHGNL